MCIVICNVYCNVFCSLFKDLYIDYTLKDEAIIESKIINFIYSDLITIISIQITVLYK